MKAVVIGCGVSGLTTGIRLAEAGWEVEIWARDLPPRTTSNVAAAIWYPYKALPQDRVLGWGQRSLEVFYEVAEEKSSGVVISEAIEVFHEDAPEPWWVSGVRHFRYATANELPGGYNSGYVFETAVIETGLYLPYLMARFERLGGRIAVWEIHNLVDALREAETVVNCAGLGTLSFMPDPELYPVRGQILRVNKPADIEYSYLDDEEDSDDVLAYIVPRSNDCVLGGTAIAGDWSLEVREATDKKIVERCTRLWPGIEKMEVREHVVGLRPGRSSVCVEVITLPGGGRVAHNYGHSGAGVTLSWGCAEEVVERLGQNPPVRRS